MTQVLTDRATLEQAIDAFELVLRNLAAGGGSKSINKLVARENAEFTKALRAALANAEPTKPNPKLWLWKNFVDGKQEYWAFDNLYPINMNDDDPQTLGDPCGYALFKPSRNGRKEQQ